nr:E3 ubiquitin-protein ligase KCMF1-like [Aedes albopictus]
MASDNDGIICSYCTSIDFDGNRYACLVCEGYDLCEDCFFEKSFTLDHKPYHPMQKILTEAAFFKSLEESESGEVDKFCCPYCTEKDFAAGNLIHHCRKYHRVGGHPVRCPICLVYRSIDVRFVKNGLFQHAREQHSEYCVQVQEPSAPCATGFLECPICFGQMLAKDDTRSLPCLHQFHSQCIEDWLETNPTCPVCRLEIT